MVLLSWKHLKAPGDDDLGKRRENGGDNQSSTDYDERSPLLINAEDVDTKSE